MNFRQKKRLYKKELKRIQKEHKPESTNGFFDKIKEKLFQLHTWFEWKNYIKYVNEWDGDKYLVDMIIYKLEIMRLSNQIFSQVVDEEKNIYLEELTTAINLGKKAVNTRFDNDAWEFSKNHFYNYIEIYKIHTDEVLYTTSKVLEKDNGASGLGWLHGLNLKEADEWCKANNHKEWEDVTYTYSGEFDTEENRELYYKKQRDAQEAEQQAYDDFFLYISKHFRGWWF